MDLPPEFVQEIPHLLRLAGARIREGDVKTGLWIIMKLSNKIESTESQQDSAEKAAS